MISKKLSVLQHLGTLGFKFYGLGFLNFVPSVYAPDLPTVNVDPECLPASGGILAAAMRETTCAGLKNRCWMLCRFCKDLAFISA